MKLGAFSISLTVKDLPTSRAFYEKLGFSEMGGSMDENWLIMKNGDAIIGLFQGMFDKNVITFNPGWTQNAEPSDPFDDVRDIQKDLLASGVTLAAKADESTTGPAHVMLTDPDGNAILIDQHR